MAGRIMPRESDSRYRTPSSRESATPASRAYRLSGSHATPLDRQVVPPTNEDFSNSPTVAPASAAANAAVSPAAPVPSTTTSNSAMSPPSIEDNHAK